MSFVAAAQKMSIDKGEAWEACCERLKARSGGKLADDLFAMAINIFVSKGIQSVRPDLKKSLIDFHKVRLLELSRSISSPERLSSRNLAELIHALAILNIPEQAHRMADSVQNTVQDFNAQGIAITARAFATLGIKNEALFRAIARTVLDIIYSFDAQALANTAKKKKLTNIDGFLDRENRSAAFF